MVTISILFCHGVILCQVNALPTHAANPTQAVTQTASHSTTSSKQSDGSTSSNQLPVTSPLSGIPSTDSKENEGVDPHAEAQIELEMSKRLDRYMSPLHLLHVL